MSLKHLTCPSKILSSSITAAASTFKLNNIKGWDGVDLTSADFGSQAFAVIRNANNTILELIEFDPTTIADASITILKRGLKFTGDLTTEVAANKLAWTSGDTYIDIGVDTPQMYQWLQEYVDAAIVAGGVPATTTVLGLAKASVAPASAASPIFVGDNDPRVPTADENDALAGDGGTPSADNPYTLRNKTVVAGATITGATLPVPVYQNKTDNEFYACDANDTAAMKFLGFAITDGVDAGNFEVQFTGVVSGFTGLSEGEKYYVQDAAGTIGTTIGTYEILVGVAISTTELLIQKGKRRASGSGTLTDASGSAVVTCGFRPSVVRIYAAVGNTTYGSYMSATWANGAITGVGLIYNEGSTGSGVNAARVYTSTEATYHTFSITSVTDTGFTITWTETSNMDAGAFHWEAEGEL